MKKLVFLILIVCFLITSCGVNKKDSEDSYIEIPQISEEMAPEEGPDVLASELMVGPTVIDEAENR